MASHAHALMDYTGWVSAHIVGHPLHPDPLQLALTAKRRAGKTFAVGSRWRQSDVDDSVDFTEVAFKSMICRPCVAHANFYFLQCRSR